MTVTVRLTRDELLYAAQGGTIRRIDGGLKGRTDYFAHPDPYGRDITGAMAEAAVAKWRGRWWTPTYEEIKDLADIGPRGQVRSSLDPNSPLWVRKSDKPEHAFTLVTVQVPHFHIHGWMWGHEAMQDCYWRENGRLPSFAVPQNKLRDPGGLPDFGEDIASLKARVRELEDFIGSIGLAPWKAA